MIKMFKKSTSVSKQTTLKITLEQYINFSVSQVQSIFSPNNILPARIRLVPSRYKKIVCEKYMAQFYLNRK